MNRQESIAEIERYANDLGKILDMFIERGGAEEANLRVEIRSDPLAYCCLEIERLAANYNQEEWRDPETDPEEANEWRDNVTNVVKWVYMVGLFDAQYVELPSDMSDPTPH